MSDLRHGVTPAVHAVLDVLDKGRGGWAQMSAETLRHEISLEAAGLDGIEQVGADPLQSAQALRLAALLLFAIERAAPAGAVAL
jgi:hypothetical protein